MRKPDRQQPRLFYSFCPESLIPEDHSLRAIKRMVEESFKTLDEQFARRKPSSVTRAMYSWKTEIVWQSMPM